MEESELHELDWVSIPNSPYIIKYKFHDAGYNILLSDLTFLYNEKLANGNIQDRFCTLNPYAQMKLPVILENLRKSLEKCLAGESNHSIEFEDDKLIFILKFPAVHVLCSYNIEMNLMAAEQVMHHIIRPTVLGALLCQNKILELQKRISSSENANLSISSSSSMTSQNIVDPRWLMGQSNPKETITKAFLNIQSQFKELFRENCEKYSPLKNQKSKSSASVKSASPHKKCKLEENFNDNSIIVKFEECEKFITETEPISSWSEANIKLEERECSETVPSQSQKK